MKIPRVILEGLHSVIRAMALRGLQQLFRYIRKKMKRPASPKKEGKVPAQVPDPEGSGSELAPIDDQVGWSEPPYNGDSS